MSHLKGPGAGVGHRGRGTPARTGAAERLASEPQSGGEQSEWGQGGWWGSIAGTGQGVVRWVRQGQPAAGLSGWPSLPPLHHRCLEGGSPGGSLEDGGRGAGEED